MERPQRAAAYLHDRPFGSRHDNRRRHLGVEVTAAQAFELLCGAVRDRILPCSLPKRRFAARQSVHRETTQQERDYVQRFSHFGNDLTCYRCKDSASNQHMQINLHVLIAESLKSLKSLRSLKALISLPLSAAQCAETARKRPRFLRGFPLFRAAKLQTLCRRT